jgi:hypothetical protein
MSIYRKLFGERQSDDNVQTSAHPQAETTAAKAASEDAEKRKRRKGAPMDAPLPRTFTWAATLPREAQPIELMKTFPRIANLIAAEWTEPEAMYDYFDELLHDRRGNRRGFPPAVFAELLALRKHYATLHRPPTAGW